MLRCSWEILPWLGDEVNTSHSGAKRKAAKKVGWLAEAVERTQCETHTPDLWCAGTYRVKGIERKWESEREEKRQMRQSDPVTGDSPSVLRWLYCDREAGFCVCPRVCVGTPVPIIHCLSAAGSQTEDNSSGFCLVYCKASDFSASLEWTQWWVTAKTRGRQRDKSCSKGHGMNLNWV